SAPAPDRSSTIRMARPRRRLTRTHTHLFLPYLMKGATTVAGKPTRRQFLKSSAVTTGAILGARYLPSPTRAADAPRNKLRVAVIGAGGMGGYSVDSALNERLVALCDVDDNTIAKVMKEKVSKKVKDGPE